ncbi:hypothetical protein BX600DRAFT_431792 [Xylariales sp. PMI_506]|nr:hypothetical protein BX600DRAFT_431792 [Xylariales sp. PMI_506]
MSNRPIIQAQVSSANMPSIHDLKASTSTGQEWETLLSELIDGVYKSDYDAYQGFLLTIQEGSKEVHHGLQTYKGLTKEEADEIVNISTLPQSLKLKKLQEMSTVNENAALDALLVADGYVKAIRYWLLKRHEPGYLPNPDDAVGREDDYLISVGISKLRAAEHCWPARSEVRINVKAETRKYPSEIVQQPMWTEDEAIISCLQDCIKVPQLSCQQSSSLNLTHSTKLCQSNNQQDPNQESIISTEPYLPDLYQDRNLGMESSTELCRSGYQQKPHLDVTLTIKAYTIALSNDESMRSDYQLEQMPSPIFKISDWRRAKRGGIELLVHRMLLDGSTTQIYELEADVQNDDEEALLAFWADFKGGRDAVVKSLTHHMLRILRHGNKSGPFEIQWVGYPDTPKHTTWEPYSKVKRCIPTELQRYLRNVS